MKKTPKEWRAYHHKKGISYRTFSWTFDARVKENKISLKTKMTEREFFNKYVL